MVEEKALEQTGPRRRAASEHKFQKKDRFRRNLVFWNSHGHFEHVDRNINSSPGEKKRYFYCIAGAYISRFRVSAR
jgi:hypothetical protein